MKRFEKKFTIPSYLALAFEADLIQFGFTEIYEERSVTSIYYDTDDFLNFVESEEGISNRQKIRIRFYNNQINKAIIEYKNKNAELGWKDYSDLSELNAFNSSLKLNLSNFLNENLIIEIPKIISYQYILTLGINYFRRYFISFDEKTRITVDKSIKFTRIISSREGIALDLGVLIEESIIEIKYDFYSSSENIILKNLADIYNLNLSRYSKYCEGIKLFYL